VQGFLLDLESPYLQPRPFLTQKSKRAFGISGNVHPVTLGSPPSLAGRQRSIAASTTTDIKSIAAWNRQCVLKELRDCEYWKSGADAAARPNGLPALARITLRSTLLTPQYR
jgi:hypothetical protein